MSLRDDLVRKLRASLSEPSVKLKQVELAKLMGVTPKHLNQMLLHKAGSFEVFDKAATALGLQWEVSLAPLTCPRCGHSPMHVDPEGDLWHLWSDEGGMRSMSIGCPSTPKT